jgi:hypothetical protein
VDEVIHAFDSRKRRTIADVLPGTVARSASKFDPTESHSDTRPPEIDGDQRSNDYFPTGEHRMDASLKTLQASATIARKPTNESSFYDSQSKKSSMVVT